MYFFCIDIGGKRHCFDVPLLLDPKLIHGPDPVNFPLLDVAVTVIQIVKMIEPSGKHSELGTKLLEVSTNFIQTVRASLPKGVELKEKNAQGTGAISA